MKIEIFTCSGKRLFMVKAGDVSPFATLCTTLAADIGTGSIVGVATAVCAGGPGALFWMIVAAFWVWPQSLQKAYWQ